MALRSMTAVAWTDTDRVSFSFLSLFNCLDMVLYYPPANSERAIAYNPAAPGHIEALTQFKLQINLLLQVIQVSKIIPDWKAVKPPQGMGNYRPLQHPHLGPVARLGLRRAKHIGFETYASNRTILG